MVAHVARRPVSLNGLCRFITCQRGDAVSHRADSAARHSSGRRRTRQTTGTRDHFGTDAARCHRPHQYADAPRAERPVELATRDAIPWKSNAASESPYSLCPCSATRLSCFGKPHRGVCRSMKPTFRTSRLISARCGGRVGARKQFHFRALG
jgi:hypothetical protein